MEKLYIMCSDCGEVFETLEIAYDHEFDAGHSNDFQIMPESIAF
jgi:hypothetical protein